MTDEWIDEVLNSLTNEVEWSVQVPGSVKINREREAEVIKQAKATILAKQAEAVEAAQIQELQYIQNCKTRERNGDEGEVFCANCGMMLEVEQDPCGCDYVTRDRLSQLTNNTEKE